MGQQIILKENNKFALYSQICEGFLLDDVTKEEIIDYMVESERLSVIIRVNKIVQKLKEGKKPYWQFQLTYIEAAERNERSLKEENEGTEK